MTYTEAQALIARIAADMATGHETEAFEGLVSISKAIDAWNQEAIKRVVMAGHWNEVSA